MLQKRRNRGSDNKGDRFLITINVIGSPGPLRFVVHEGDLVSHVIDIALKSYHRAGRLPVLGTDANNFVLYHTNTGPDALNPRETIGSVGGRNFTLFKNQLREENSEMIEHNKRHASLFLVGKHHIRGRGLRAKIKKSFSLTKLSSL